MLRREALTLLAAAAGMAALPGGARAAEETPFSIDALKARAKALAAKDFAPRPQVPQPWIDLSYDQYKAIRFDTKRAYWRGTDSPIHVDFFQPGLYFPHAVQINAVEDGMSRPIRFDLSMFHKSDIVPDLPEDGALGFSGFRIRTELQKPEVFEEFLVMQGASYFRAIGKGQFYGLSARGLAINTADQQGEEFPDFIEYWIERPAPRMEGFRIHALMDSPSTTGVYSFDIYPGAQTILNVRASLFPRKALDHIGLGPLTSMFLFDETNRDRFSDFRPAVHDSDGLLVHNGAGELLWRPLANPKHLQVSSFVDDQPRGFGLMQRAGRFSDFADLEARYHLRPSLWIEPGENWGKGAVTLVEIPADREIYDNIVAYWRPRDVVPAGQKHQFTYRMIWGEDPDLETDVARITNTRMGKRFRGGFITTVDFGSHSKIPEKLDDVVLHVSSNRGEVSPGILQRNPETGGVRLAFTFDPGEAQSVELRAQLRHGDQTISEVWLYRWTA